MSLLGVLRLTTETPDALCPTLAEAQSAVTARLGEITGGDYEARYRLLRGARDERDALHLELYDERGDVLLTREVPIEAGGCADAAQALALILDRYFEQLSAPEAASSPAVATAAPPAVLATPAEKGSLVASDPAPQERPWEPSPWGLRAAGGGGLLGGQGTGFVGLGSEFWWRRTWSLALDLGWTSLERSDSNGAQRVAAHSYWGLLAAQGWARAGSWLLGVGPSLGGQVEVAQASGLEVDDSPATRFVLGMGGLAALRFELSSRWSIETNVRLLALLGGASKRFVIDEVDGSQTEVLPVATSLFLWGGGLQLRL